MNSIFRLLDFIPAEILFPQKCFTNLASHTRTLMQAGDSPGYCVMYYINHAKPPHDLFCLLNYPTNSEVAWKAYLMLSSTIGHNVETCSILAAGSTENEDRFSVLADVIDEMNAEKASQTCIDYIIPALQFATPFAQPHLVFIALTIISRYTHVITIKLLVRI